MDEALLHLLGIGGAAIGGGLLTKEAIDRLSDIGEQAVVGTTIGETAVPGAMELAQTGLEQAQFRPFTVTSATGGAFGVTPQVDPVTGEVTALGTTMTLSPAEQALQNRMMGQAALFAGQPPAGAARLAEAGEQTLARGQGLLGLPTFGTDLAQQAAQRTYGLGEQFMGQAGMPTTDREAAVYERIRAAQRPEEERQRLALEERLAQQGRLGVRTAMFGGTPEQLAMSKAQAEAQNMAMLNAMQQAQREQAQQAALGAQYTGLGSNLAAQRQALAQARQAQALQAMQAGQGLLGGGLGLQQAQQQLAQGALAGAYLPQAQLLNVQQAAQIYPQLQQRGQLSGAGLFGETAMSGLEARLIAEQAKANLLGNLGSGLLSGLVSPVALQDGGVGSLLTGVLGKFFPEETTTDT